MFIDEPFQPLFSVDLLMILAWSIAFYEKEHKEK